MKVEFYSETYGEPSKDFKLRREGNLKRYQVYVSDIVENGWKGGTNSSSKHSEYLPDPLQSDPVVLPGTHTALTMALLLIIFPGRLLSSSCPHLLRVDRHVKILRSVAL